jgi:hypothetical protein
VKALRYEGPYSIGLMPNVPVVELPRGAKRNGSIIIVKRGTVRTAGTRLLFTACGKKFTVPKRFIWGVYSDAIGKKIWGFKNRPLEVNELSRPKQSTARTL